MANVSHLERMSKELKCPICLSLLNSAVSLTCNHVFCNSCIEKSMRSDSACPVCKIPYRRREVRAAPHMDTLVSIYKSMEVASGVNILVSQPVPLTRLSGQENPAIDEMVSRSEKSCRGTLNIQKQRRTGEKTLKESSTRKPKSCSSNPLRSFRANKRIQVPQHPLEETATKPANSEAGKSKLIKNGSQRNALTLEGRLRLGEQGDKLFSPFFWLRDEEDVEITPQLTEGDAVNDSPSGAPCFSDIKDSDDDNHHNTISKHADIFESEMFEWTQRPCSPELCSSPMKMQDKETDANERVQEKEQKGALHRPDICRMSKVDNEDHTTLQKETDDMEGVCTTLSPPKIKKANHEGGTKRSRNGVNKMRESMQKKRGKRPADEVTGIFTTSWKGAYDQEKYGYTGEFVKMKENIHKRGKKVALDTKSTEGTTKVVDACDCVEAFNQGDRNMADLLDSFNLEEGEGTSHKSDNICMNNEKTTESDQQCIDRVRRLKGQDSRNSKNNITETNKAFISQSPTAPSPVDGVINVSNSKRRTKKGEMMNSKDLKSLKHVSFTNGSSNVKSADGIPSAGEIVARKESQPSREVHSSSNVRVEKNSNAPAMSNATALRKCDKVSGIHCGFCQTSEESNLSGLMMHYLKGKPVAADQEGGSSAIHAHRNCTEWAPNVYFQDGVVINLESELARSRRIKCCCCGLKGAALGCYEKSCRKSFHFPCAKLTPQCRWDDDNFVMLCPLHAFHKLPKEAGGSHLEEKKKCVPNKASNIEQSHAAVSATVSTTSRWGSHGLFSKFVLCCSALTRMEKDTVVKFERLSGVKLLKSWDSRATHVIASSDENGAGRRTFKYLMGILEGKWIVSIEWIKACMEVKEPVDEQLYEINIDIHGVRDGPRLGRLRLLSKEPKIFNGFKFYFTGDFVASYKGYLQDLIIAAGGAVLHRKPIPVDHEAQSSKCTDSVTFLIYSLELPHDCSPGKTNLILNRRKYDAEALARSTGAVAVSNSWILNSMAACKLQNIGE